MQDISGVLMLCESMPIINDDVAQKIIDQIKTTASTANTLDELFSFEHQLSNIVAKRRIDAITPVLDNIEKDSHINTNSVVEWNQIKKLLGQYALFQIRMTIPINGCKILLEDKEDTTVDEEASAAHHCNSSDRIDHRDTIFEYASRMLKNMVAYYNEKITIHDKEFQATLRTKLAVETILIEEMLEYIIPKDDSSEDININWLVALAQCYHFMLEAYLFHDNEAYSFMLKGREEKFQKLVELYERIKILVPDFETPELPDPVGINIPDSFTENAVNNQQATNNSGCYVATAVYGSYDCPEVWTLRRFRDNALATTWYGQIFIRTYYAISPTLVKWFGKTKWFKNLLKPTLDRIVKQLKENGIEDTPYDDLTW